MKPEPHSLPGLRLIPEIYCFKLNPVRHNPILRKLDMQFSGAVLSVENDVVMGNVRGDFCDDPGPTPRGWRGRIHFPTYLKADEVIAKLANYCRAQLDIPGVIKGNVIVTSVDGAFQGSGLPERYSKD